MNLWVIRLREDVVGGYDMVHGAVVRASDQDEAWYLLKASQGDTLYPRHQYTIEQASNARTNEPSVLLIDYHAG